MIESLYFAPVNMAPELRCGQELPLPILLASPSPESVCRVTTKYLSGIEFLYLRVVRCHALVLIELLAFPRKVRSPELAAGWESVCPGV